MVGGRQQIQGMEGETGDTSGDDDDDDENSAPQEDSITSQQEDPPEHEGSILPLFSSDMIHHSNRICEQEYVALLLILIFQTQWLRMVGMHQLHHHLHCFVLSILKTWQLQ